MARRTLLEPIALVALLAWPLHALVTTSSLANGATGVGAVDTPVRVFLVAGQSNAEGHDTHAWEIDRYPPFVGAAAPQPDVLFWYEHGGPSGYTSGGWIPMQPAPQTQVFGPELTFARLVGDETSARIAIIKSTSGGTNLAVDWDPGNTSGQGMYERTLALMQTALTNLTNSGVDWRLEGVVWQQGENDMLNNTYVAQYGARLTALIDRFRTDLGEPDLKWFVGETSFKGIWGIDYANNMRILRDHQLAVAGADPLVYFVRTSHLAFKINTGQPHYHFGSEGMLQLGEVHAAAYLSTIGIDLAHESEEFCCGLPADPGSTVRVFVLAGQRSMEGERAYVAEIPHHPEFDELGELQHDVFYRYRLGGGTHTSTDWAPLGPADYLENFGPELSFGNSVDRLLDDPVAVIKIADSAAFMVDWLPTPMNASRPQYEGAIRFIGQALRDLSDAGLNPVLEGVIWLPAEHDAWWGPYRQQYAVNLTTLVANMRADLAAPDLKWFVAELADNMMWGQSNLDELDAKIQSVADADPLLWFVETDTVPTPNLSATFETEGVLHLGRLMAEAYVATTD
jgi:hypothetical protein